MFCEKCGQSVNSDARFCSRCGAMVANSLGSSPSITSKNKSVFYEACGVAGTATRHFLRAGAKVWITSAIGLLLFVGIYFNFIGNPSTPTQQIAQDTRDYVAEAFNNMTPAQHLEAAQQAARPDATIDQINEGLRHLGTIPPSAVEATKAKPLEQKLKMAQKKRRAEADRKQALLEAKAKRLLRDQLAKSIEGSLLDEGFNVDVNAIGNDHTVLHLKWVLVSKAMAHQLSEQSDFFEKARAVGFKRVEITDGYDQTWYWNLK
jgi:hypothetical protein